MIEGLNQDALALLEEQLLGEMKRREQVDPASFFPWHHRQDWVLNGLDDVIADGKDIRIMLAAGGNRGGKSALGKGLYSRFMRREHRIAKQLRTTDRLTGEIRRKNDTDPVTVWIVPPTLEKVRQDWVNPSDGFSIRHWLGDLFMHEQKTPDYVFYSRPPGLSKDDAEKFWAAGKLEYFDKTILKSHDQDLLTFEASAVDLCIVDEEIMDQSKWNSMLLRIGTPNGVLVMCYTPLHGLSWSYDRYWRPLIKLNVARELSDRCWVHDTGKGACVVAVQFGAADNPLAADYAVEIENDPGMSEAEKNARLYGEYGFVEGALISALSGIDVITPELDHQKYVVDYLPGMEFKPRDKERFGKEKAGGRIVSWYLVTDPNKSYGAVLSAIDNVGNVFFVWEHLESEWPDRLHADAFKDAERKWVKPGQNVRRIADPGSAGAQSIINMGDLGLFFETAQKGHGSVSESVKRLRSFAWSDPNHAHPITGKLGAPRVYFYRPSIISRWKDRSGNTNIGCRLADQISQARQTDNENAPPDTPHKSVRSKLDLFDCARYTVMAVTIPTGDEDDGGTLGRSDFKLRPLPLGEKDTYNALDEDFFVPEYSFG